MAFSAKEKQYAGVTAAVLGAVAIYMFVVDPFITAYSDTKTKVAKARDDTDHAQTLFLTESQKQKLWTKMLAEGLKSDSEQSQSQALGAVLQWAVGAGVNVVGTQMEPVSRQENKFFITTFKFTGVGSTRSISRWLLAIEKGTVPAAPPSTVAGRIPLRIDDLAVSPRKTGTDDLQAVVTLSTLSLQRDANETPKNDNAKPASASGGPVAMGDGQ